MVIRARAHTSPEVECPDLRAIDDELPFSSVNRNHCVGVVDEHERDLDMIRLAMLPGLHQVHSDSRMKLHTLCDHAACATRPIRCEEYASDQKQFVEHRRPKKSLLLSCRLSVNYEMVTSG